LTSEPRAQIVEAPWRSHLEAGAFQARHVRCIQRDVVMVFGATQEGDAVCLAAYLQADLLFVEFFAVADVRNVQRHVSQLLVAFHRGLLRG